MLVVLVNDADAVYPVRIDPTFSDANWISMGCFPGANGPVNAPVVDSSGNLYIDGGRQSGQLHCQMGREQLDGAGFGDERRP